jgi:hypothetical protein
MLLRAIITFGYWIFRVMIVTTKLTLDIFPDTPQRLTEMFSHPTTFLPVKTNYFSPFSGLNSFILICPAADHIRAVCHLAT